MRWHTGTIRYAAFALLLFAMAGCAAQQAVPDGGKPPATANAQPLAVAYADGVYRGFYNDGGIEQFCVEFTLKDGAFTAVALHAVNYKDGDYLDPNATRIQSQVASQYTEAAEYLIGKPVYAVADLLDSTAVATDRDAVTSATLRTGKLASAIGDGLSRGVFQTTDTTRLVLPAAAPDGSYRGFYFDNAKETVSVRFTLKDNAFVELDVEAEGSGALVAYCGACAKNLRGEALGALSALYAPDASVSGEEAGMVVSAFMDALARGVYEPVATTVLARLSGYANGVYRGFYYEGGIEQVSVQFELVSDRFVSVRYRALSYTDGDYTAEEADGRQAAIYRQYLELSDYLVGKPVASVYDLFAPGEIASDADASSGATLHANQLVSALVDGLNRGVYRYGEID